MSYVLNYYCLNSLETRTTEIITFKISPTCHLALNLASNLVTIICLRYNVTEEIILFAVIFLLYSFLTSRFQSFLTSDNFLL